MQFITSIVILKSENLIDYNSKIVSIGSCFAENMGEKFNYFKLNNVVNPFGIIFNPVSIENVFFRAVNEVAFTENDVFFHNERWQCYEVHSVLSNENKEDYLLNLNQILLEFKYHIGTATNIILTYGTSWVYRLRQAQSDKNIIVANCHKVAQNQFDKKLLSINEIEKSIENTINLILKVNPNCSFIFTVSPVRHIKDGFVENTLSKAHLISAVHKTRNSQLATRNLIYFPSFEIMMDELRDYRFYTEDMLHPNQIAVDYIFEKFRLSQISERIYPTMNEVSNIQKSLLHKPFNPNSPTHTKFLSNLKSKIDALKKTLPNIEF